MTERLATLHRLIEEAAARGAWHLMLLLSYEADQEAKRQSPRVPEEKGA